MRKLGHTLHSLSVLAALGLGLMGCPVWENPDDGHGPGPGPYDAGTVDSGARSCRVNSDCPGGYCSASATNPNGVCVTSQTCRQTSDCFGSNRCDSRGVCVPGCASNNECSAIASGLVCDSTTRQCVPSGACSTDSDCASTPATPVCLGGACQPRSNQCQFDYQCTGAGQACVDGQCVVGCTAANAGTVCAAGQVCTNGRCTYPTSGDCNGACASGQICVSGACLTTCNSDAACGAGFQCLNGVCRVDTRPRPFCTQDSECSAGSVCYNGACRRECPTPGTGTDGGCMRVDVQFNLCLADNMGRNLCTSTNEQRPECARTADCSAGRQCVNAQCQ